MTEWFKKIQHLNPDGYTSRQGFYNFQAECGHIFNTQIRIYELYYRELCPTCKSIPLWYDKTINIDNPYIGYKGYYYFKSECGHTNKLRYETFSQKYKEICPVCKDNANKAIKLKKTEELQQKQNNCKIYIPNWYDESINDGYRGELNKYNFKTSCGHIVYCTVYRFKYVYKGLCHECHRNSKLPELWNSISHLNPDGWKGINHRYKSVSKCGHEFPMMWRVFKEKYLDKCPLCLEAPWFRHDLNPGGYIDKLHPYNFELECGHIINITAYAFLNKKHTMCQVCGPDWFDKSINPEGYRGSTEKYFHRSKCGHVVDYPMLYSTFYSQFLDYCPNCKEYDNRFLSKEEQEVSDYVESIYKGTVKRSARILGGYKQIDIYLPDVNLAIEYNGIKWHCDKESGKDKSYHVEKTNICSKQGIQLLHINSNEWKDKKKKEIWKSIISSKLNRSVNRIFARKCDIREVSTKFAMEFINDNHLQGYVGSKIKIGLYTNNELVMITTFSKFRFGNKDMWELIRCNSKLNTTVVGGMSKLISYFNNKYNNDNLPILSYADRRYSIGKSYESVGFVLERITPPNYKYFYKNNYELLFPREKFQKHKLKDILDTFDPSLTEWENMKNNQYDRIWDCGNLVYVLNN